MSNDGRALRNALGQFATGVTVVTLWNDEEIHGMTANSFTSVSLDPPLILVNIAKGNRTHDLVVEGGRFAVNVLSEQAEDVSRHFAMAGQKDVPEGVAWLTEGESPLMADALAWFDCKVWRTYEGGDHTIVVGEVEAYDAPGGRPLLFYSGQYGKLGE